MKITLEVLSGAMDGQDFKFNRSVTVGRDKTCEIALNLDKYISRRHARILVAAPDVFVEDMGSTNGTFIKGERLHGRELLQNNEIFRVGRTWLQAVWQ